MKLTLSEVLPPSVIPFWKPLITPDLDPNSDAKILQIFLQPYFAKLDGSRHCQAKTSVDLI